MPRKSTDPVTFKIRRAALAVGDACEWAEQQLTRETAPRMEYTLRWLEQCTRELRRIVDAKKGA